jgi:hypothetical protein
MRPVASINGIDNVSFYYNEAETFSADKQFAADIMKCDHHELETENVQEIIGHIKVHSAIFDQYSRIWQFEYLGSVVRVDISGTTIARDALARRKVVVGDTYKVRWRLRSGKLQQGSSQLLRC